ncbi:Inner membrane protein YbjJ [Andreprevotia sp. IGB-42]|uniref:MFS transporter n=1 Tax=Andreprevotia sp. IGB-42 TaxID=2497473 RepID=UPI001359C9DE|nr:MFS transporter [Andreprevotia sp. IGB-42]KAF0815032.1 Inner membrane protein YbjJ [Andreprevotia sp. IGB-42]
MTSSALRRAPYAVAALFFLHGLNYGSWAARLPALKARLAISDAEVGFFLLASGLGAVFSFPVTATLLHKLGAKRLCWLMSALLPLLLIALAFVPSYPLAMAIMVFEGVCASCLNVAMNAQAAEIELHGGRAIMSRLHATFSLGMLAAAMIAAALTHFTSQVQLHFMLVAVLMWAAALWAGGQLLADSPRSEVDVVRRPFSLPTGAALWVVVAVFGGTIVEGSMADWTALYLKERTGATESLAAWGLACFSITMLLTRWFGDLARTRIGPRRLLLGGGLLAGLGLGGAVLVGGYVAGLLGFVMVGLGVAAVSPCLYQVAARQGPVALAAATTTGSVGFLVGPPMIGFIAHHLHLGWGLGFVALSAGLIAYAATRIDW